MQSEPQANVWNRFRQHISTYAALSDDAWAEVIQRFELRSYRKRTHVLRAGAVCRHLYFIGQGLVRAYRLHEGNDITNGLFWEGHFVTALPSFLTQQPSTEGLQVLEDTSLLAICAEDLETLYEVVPAWNRVIRLVLQEAHLASIQRIEALATGNGTARYHQLLESQPQLLLRAPLQVLATYLGMTPVSLSRVRRQIARQILTSVK